MLIIDALGFFFFLKRKRTTVQSGGRRFWREPSANSCRARRHSFTLDHGNQNLGQPSLTRDSHLHTKKKKKNPPHRLFSLFPLVSVNCVWLCAREPASALACCATFPQSE